jgi:hypothetical protein
LVAYITSAATVISRESKRCSPFGGQAQRYTATSAHKPVLRSVLEHCLPSCSSNQPLVLATHRDGPIDQSAVLGTRWGILQRYAHESKFGEFLKGARTRLYAVATGVRSMSSVQSRVKF